MSSMRHALQKAGLVPTDRVNAVDEAERQRLQAQEERSGRLAGARMGVDMSADKKQERWMASAARETTKAGSRVGTRAYFDRFRK